MNDNDDPKWEEKISKMLQEYNNKYQIFKDPDDAKKVRYVIEDTHKIRFFEFADDMTQKDVFNDDIVQLVCLRPQCWPPAPVPGPSRRGKARWW